MKLGLAGVLPEWDQIDAPAARVVRDLGFRGVSVFFSRPRETDLGKLGALRSTLRDEGLECAQVNGAYEVLVSPDPGSRRLGIDTVGALCRIARNLEGGTVYVRPGSLSAAGPWFPHPGNHGAEVFDRLVDSLRQVCRFAEGEGVTLAVEGHVLSPLDTPARVRSLLDAVGSPALKFNMDPVNFIGTVQAVHHSAAVVGELCDLLGGDTAAVHLKDVRLRDELVVHIEEAAPGEGVLDFGALLRRLDSCCGDVWALIEHLPAEKVPAARSAVLTAAREHSVDL